MANNENGVLSSIANGIHLKVLSVSNYKDMIRSIVTSSWATEGQKRQVLKFVEYQETKLKEVLDLINELEARLNN
jgi:hypothetical protein